MSNQVLYSIGEKRPTEEARKYFAQSIKLNDSVRNLRAYYGVCPVPIRGPASDLSQCAPFMYSPNNTPHPIHTIHQCITHDTMHHIQYNTSNASQYTPFIHHTKYALLRCGSGLHGLSNNRLGCWGVCWPVSHWWFLTGGTSSFPPQASGSAVSPWPRSLGCATPSDPGRIDPPPPTVSHFVLQRRAGRFLAKLVHKERELIFVVPSALFKTIAWHPDRVGVGSVGGVTRESLPTTILETF